MTILWSTIIPTIGRSSLERAVNSVLEQTPGTGDFEIIVVNDSGSELAPATWQTSPHTRIIRTHRLERSVARNTGAALSRGKYLHFLDDDDWLFPGGLVDLVEQVNTSTAEWLYGGTQLVDSQGNPLISIHQNIRGNCFIQAMAGEWIPLGSSLIKSQAFFDAGGFNSHLRVTEDVDLCRRIALIGNFDCVPGLISCITMDRHGSSTPWHLHSQQSRTAREAILGRRNVFAHLRSSIQASEWGRKFWCGRSVRLYLTSMVWNLDQRRLFTSLSRAIFTLACLASSGTALGSLDFWQAVFHPYRSFAFPHDSEHLH